MKTISDSLKENNLNSPYLNYASNTFSQFGDDGIINQLLKELNIDTGVVVEFGAWDGLYCSNSYNLWRNKGFNAILIEANPQKANELIQLTSKVSNVESSQGIISSNPNADNSLDSILSRSKFNINNDNLALISIDVDGDDYGIFSSIIKYRPAIFMVETAGGWPWDTEYIGTGASLKSLTNLAITKDYTLVCCNGNAYFVRNDKLNLLKHYNSNLTIQDYHMKDNFVNGILTNLDPDGQVLEYMYWQHQDYLNHIQLEKDKLLSL